MNPSTVTKRILLLLCFTCKNNSSAFTASSSLQATTSTRNNPRKSAVESKLFAAKKKKVTQKKEANHDKWQPHFDQLVHYKEQHGHFDELDSSSPLGVWLLDQHNAYINLKMKRKSKMTKKRVAALEQIGAIPEDLWEENRFTQTLKD
mmetsp:Transcript_36495/g.65705  ORF Transcript_36495/g.65705 Transcript_36495/m.65705 type:complete len:148 (-) Transcript_36495:193-636(-)|eukprot:CAMPEP_0201868428 /NCGR_PEP_ID=MMETSP0902-20130614/2317_1 /ASSEMBLY_ACC=CAM_ASM_000551 /TAXON_ID=420261 /ORGANISM="Thalassiosira antarctica, Strain CCMP982" /LENGTH=147 /DNA_ID=CAMNT_0048393771 /DNA_START=47 /DNA_END=490 /DNA_ORIENTATION=+